MEKAKIEFLKPEEQENADVLASAAERLSGKEQTAGDTGQGSYTVLFNPQKLSLRGSGEALRAAKGNISTGENGAQGQSMVNALYGCVLSMELILCNFEQGIQDTAEGFIGAMKHPARRKVRFIWGKFSFQGVLSGVSTEYTMFSEQGIPVRGTLSLSITQDTVNEEQEEYWENAYRRFF